MNKPGRPTHRYRIYCDLVIGKRLFVRKKPLMRGISEQRNVPVRVVKDVYNRCIRPQLAAGKTVADLF